VTQCFDVDVTNTMCGCIARGVDVYVLFSFT